jgi:hypothetical protein
MIRSATHLSKLPFATDQRSLLLAVRSLVGLLCERLSTSDSPYVCTEDGTLGGLHLDAIVAGLQSHGREFDATLAELGSHETEADLVAEIVDSLGRILDIATRRTTGSPDHGTFR